MVSVSNAAERSIQMRTDHCSGHHKGPWGLGRPLLWEWWRQESDWNGFKREPGATPPPGAYPTEKYRCMHQKTRPSKDVQSHVLVMAKNRGIPMRFNCMTNQFWCIPSVEYYTAMKRNELLLHATRMTLINIMVSKRQRKAHTV